MESLGGLAIHKILSKLGPKDTAIFGCVNHSFQEWASDDSLWSHFCAQELHLPSPRDPFDNLSLSFKVSLCPPPLLLFSIHIIQLPIYIICVL